MFMIFGVFFVLLNNFWIVFLELIRIENKFEKNKTYPTGLSPKARPNLPPPPHLEARAAGRPTFARRRFPSASRHSTIGERLR
jgi:hypothetical protein